MPQYQVDVRFTDVNEPDALAARLAVENRLRSAGFEKWRVVSVHATTTPPSGPGRAPTAPLHGRAQNAAYTGAVLLVAAIVAWVLWFLWVLTG
jgi:hypothetical protein